MSENNSVSVSPSMMETIVGELQARLGQMTSQYEAQLIVLRAQANEELKKRDDEIASLRKKLEKAENVSAEEAKPSTSEEG